MRRRTEVLDRMARLMEETPPAGETNARDGQDRETDTGRFDHVAERLDRLAERLEATCASLVPVGSSDHGPAITAWRMPASLDHPGSRGTGSDLRPGQAHIEIGACSTTVTYRPESNAARLAILGSGWTGLARYDFGNGQWITRAEQIIAAMDGSLSFHGRQPDLTGFRTFARSHVRRIVTTAIDSAIQDADLYRAITVGAPDFLRDCVDVCRQTIPALQTPKEPQP